MESSIIKRKQKTKIDAVNHVKLKRRGGTKVEKRNKNDKRKSIKK
jgi:hypothetical protein